MAPEPTCLAVDPWGLRRGRELAADNEVVKAAGVDPLEAADFHAACFEPEPALHPPGRVAPKARHSFLDAVLATAEYRELHAQTSLDLFASEVGAESLAARWAKAKPDVEKDEEAKGDDPDAVNPAAVRAGVEAVRSATADVREAYEAATACGLGPGSSGGKLDAARMASVFKRVRNDATLRRIVDHAGRFRRLAQAKQRQKTSHGQDELVGVTLGRDLASLLPQELHRLSDRANPLWAEAAARFAEGRLQQWDRRGVEPVGKGPVVIVVDESGSMAGDKIETAKAVALAIFWIAKYQRRFAVLGAFSGGTQGRWLVLPPGKTDEAALLDWLTAFLGGGTEMDCPLTELPALWDSFGCPNGKTDVVMVTDALVSAKPEQVASFNAWRAREKARVITIVIDEPPGDLSLVSDEVHRARSQLSLTDEGVLSALSI